jgi:putative RNA 2'-phosphotransferase
MTPAPPESVALSKLMSLILRHRPHDFGVALDAAGWTTVDALLGALAGRGRNVSREQLIAVVRSSDKQRFALSPDGARIRANQGHTVSVSLGHEQRDPPDLLFHGTVARFLPSIRARGLERGRRHHVHLSASRAEAEAVGARRGRPVVLDVLAGRMRAAGHLFLLAPNGVWLTDQVPPEFLISLTAPPRPRTSR